MPSSENFWQVPAADLMAQLGATTGGLSEAEARQRLRAMQSQARVARPWKRDALLLLAQYKNPLILLLVFAVVLSLMLGDYSDSLIVLVILLFTGILGFVQERNAGRAVEKLRALIYNKAEVRRGGAAMEIPTHEVVPGDIVLLNAGDIIPADALILEANDLHVNESVLTGESFPAEKFATPSQPGDNQAKAINAVYNGTSVINGTATVLAVHTAGESALGKIAASLATTDAETAFEKGIRQFGYLLMRITLIIAGMILIVNVWFHKPLADAILFALALAVGLAPELLPAIVTITLSAGARRMAAKRVIVKKLSAIQNLGEMDVLCSDKTGTLTEGNVKVETAVDMHGQPDSRVMLHAYLNAFFETGFSNPIDEALRGIPPPDISAFRKVDEVPYDFIRKRLSIVVSEGGEHLMISKGAVQNILAICSHAQQADGSVVVLNAVQATIEAQAAQFGEQGLRVIAVCTRDVTGDPVINKDDETGMTFTGFIILSDPPKAGIIESLHQLRRTGVALKIISGDNRLVVAHLTRVIGLPGHKVITGTELHHMTDEALQRKAGSCNAFAEIEPAQKERIIRALQQAGHAVGYLGDGINDANAIKAADVGISIHNAVDVAKEAADLVLLEQNIDVIRDGVLEGRKTFSNTMKYIYVTTSANFGNMCSMAVAAMILPFLPLLPSQILLNNFLSDLPALTIASDKVDKEMTMKPRRWDIAFIRRFMIIFGLQSSLFDFATFGVLLYVFHTAPEAFRTGWFIESLLTEILILLVIRTRRSILQSRPSGWLTLASAITFFAAIILPYLPVAEFFSFAPLPLPLLGAILGIALAYVLSAELTKRYLMRRL